MYAVSGSVVTAEHMSDSTMYVLVRWAMECARCTLYASVCWSSEQYSNCLYWVGYELVGVIRLEGDMATI